MAQTRSRTLIQQLGFNDPDLRSPTHDALVTWTVANIRPFIERDFDPWKELEGLKKKASKALESRFEEYQQQIQDHLKSIQDNQKRMEADPTASWWKGYIKSHQNELALITEKSVQTEKRMAAPLALPQAPEIQIKTTLEKPVTTDNNYIVGFVDVLAEVRYPYLYLGDDITLKFEKASRHYYFEAKPAIPSLGELLRQLRTYQTYVDDRDYRFVVVSPDARFQKMIEDQGIGFWHTPDNYHHENQKSPG